MSADVNTVSQEISRLIQERTAGMSDADRQKVVEQVRSQLGSAGQGGQPQQGQPSQGTQQPQTGTQRGSAPR